MPVWCSTNWATSPPTLTINFSSVLWQRHFPASHPKRVFCVAVLPKSHEEVLRWLWCCRIPLRLFDSALSNRHTTLWFVDAVSTKDFPNSKTPSCVQQNFLIQYNGEYFDFVWLKIKKGSFMLMVPVVCGRKRRERANVSGVSSNSRPSPGSFSSSRHSGRNNHPPSHLHHHHQHHPQSTWNPLDNANSPIRPQSYGTLS